MLSSYFIEVHTQQDYPSSEYDAAAGRLTQMVTSILADKTAIAQLTHDAPRDTCHSDLEVGLEDTPTGRQLIAKAVVDVVAKDQVKFDKAKLTKLIKATAASDEWKNMKVFKKAVPVIPSTFGGETLA